MKKPAARAPARKPGRPPSPGVDQRERLLDAALTSFAERGIAATSLRSLASAHGVTPAMLNYYFGSKDRLVDTIVNERLMPALVRQKERMLDAEGADCLALAQRFVASLHETIAENPWLPALWVREVLSEGGQLRRVFIDRIGPQLAVPIVERFAEGQQRGELNAALDPRLLFVSLIGLTMLPFAAAPIWRNVFSAGDLGPEQMLAHTISLLTVGISP